MITLFDYFCSAEMLDVPGTEVMRLVKPETGEIFESERASFGLMLLEEHCHPDRGPCHDIGAYLVRDDGQREMFGDRMRTLIVCDSERGLC